MNDTARSDTLENGAKILLVEDEPTQQLLLERMLSGVGYEVDLASNGTDALEMIKTGRYQPVLTDWEMPGMDGITLCRQVREADLPSIYILLLTSHGAVSHAVEGLRAGAEQSLRDANTQIERLSVTEADAALYEANAPAVTA